MRKQLLILLACFFTGNLLADSTSVSTYSHIHVAFLNTNHIINQEALNARYGYSVGFTKGYSYESGWGFESGMKLYVNHFNGKFYAYPPWRDFIHTFSYYYNYQPAWHTVYNHYTMMYLTVPVLAKYEWTVPSGSKFFIRGGPQFEICFSSGYDMVGDNNPYVESGIFRQEYDYKNPAVVSFFLGLGTDIHFSNDRYWRLEAQSSVGFLSNTDNKILPFTAGLSVSSPFRIKTVGDIQKKKESKREQRKLTRENPIRDFSNSLYIEMLGAGGLLSVNYERTLGYRPERITNMMLRMGVCWMDYSPGLLGGIYFAIGKKQLKAELGGGIAYDRIDIWPHLNIGMRYSAKNGLLLRTGLTPIFENFTFRFVYFGVSIGYRW